MSLPAIFKVSPTYSEDLLALLRRTQLGTNGAIYRHLDTSIRIQQLVNPLFVYIQRYDKVLGNITFCRRILPDNTTVFYIRYFAFDQHWSASSSESKSTSASKSTLLRKGISLFFDELFEGKYDGIPEMCYAYIEPNNSRSIWMAESFQFNVIASIKTVAVSRYFPKKMNSCKRLFGEWLEHYSTLLHDTYANHNLFFPHHTLKDQPIYGCVENGRLTMACKAHIVNWEIIRLPGSFGNVLIRVIPYIPLLNRIIKPKSHRFVVIEGLVADSIAPQNLNSFLEHILADTQTNLLVYWYDQNDCVRANMLGKLRKGLAKYIVPKQEIKLVAKFNSNKPRDLSKPFYVSAFDLI